MRHNPKPVGKEVGAKVLLYDLETFAGLGYAWRGYDTSIIRWVRPPGNICAIGWKWLHEKTAHVKALPDFPGYKPDNWDNTNLLSHFLKDYRQADIVIAQNGLDFDQRVLRTNLAKRGLEIPPPVQVIDTLLMARRLFKFPSNRLDDLGEFLGVGRKVKHPGFDMWEGCMNGDKKSWALMKKYCKGDVFPLLEGIYRKMAAWDPRHPDLTNWTRRTACPVCESSVAERRGWQFTQATKRRRLVCKSCGKWYLGPRMKAPKW